MPPVFEARKSGRHEGSGSGVSIVEVVLVAKK